jgi:hypothetical protein
MIAGVGLAGVFIAFLVAASGKWSESAFSQALKSVHFAARDFTWLEGVPAVILGIVLVLTVCALLYRAGTSATAEPQV